MDFTAPNESDVDMMHDDSMLNANLAAQYGHPQQQQRPLPPHPGIPGLSADPQNVFPGVYVPGLNPMDQPQQADAMEEYARLMGIKVENDDPNVNANAFGVPGPNNDMTKIQANAAYFENLISRDRNDAMDDGNNVTSMTLPAGLGSGMNGFLGAPMAPAPPMYNPNTELAFQDGGSRLYDPSSGFPARTHPCPSTRRPRCGRACCRPTWWARRRCRPRSSRP